MTVTHCPKTIGKDVSAPPKPLTRPSSARRGGGRRHCQVSEVPSCWRGVPCASPAAHAARPPRSRRPARGCGPSSTGAARPGSAARMVKGPSGHCGGRRGSRPESCCCPALPDRCYARGGDGPQAAPRTSVSVPCKEPGGQTKAESGPGHGCRAGQGRSRAAA